MTMMRTQTQVIIVVSPGSATERPHIHTVHRNRVYERIGRLSLVHTKDEKMTTGVMDYEGGMRQLLSHFFGICLLFAIDQVDP